ncbi:MAG: ATP-binding protein [Gammaproteobacteria bacterium]|nr:ATP-binding protein [Gammaproteobacteria bacterium]
MIVYGPRGNGKTALLRSLQKNIRRENPGVSSVWMTPDDIPTPQALLAEIAATGGLKVKKVASGIDLKLFNVSVELEDGHVLNATQLIQKRCTQTPFVLIIDEAHMLEPKVAQVLLNASQKVRGGGGAFFLVLAGTPGLEMALNQADASFWDRNALFPLGRLTVEESMEALVEPLDRFDISFADGVAADVAMRAQCYPYFIQLWGREIATHLHTHGGQCVGETLTRTVEPEVDWRRRQLYRKRYKELEEGKRGTGLLSVAVTVTTAFGRVGNQAIPVETLKEQIRSMTGPEYLTDLEELVRVGFIWEVQKPNGFFYEVGIPSLMSYVADQSQKQNVGIEM